ncbi:damage-control phosphatase ARMT1-like [Styela clava]
MSDSLPKPLSARYKESFAYETVKDRMPVILTKAIDACHKQIEPYHEKCGEKGAEDVKKVIGQMSKLRNELMTDKPFVELDDDLKDASEWNDCLNELKNSQDEKPSYFTSPWLFSECMMYRRISGILQNSDFMKSFDPYQDQKRVALDNAIPGLITMADHLKKISEERNLIQDTELLKCFQTFLKASLWSNRFDLSLTAGENKDHESHNPVETLQELESYLLADNSEAIFKHLCNVKQSGNKIRVDMVIDNAGFEFSSDIMLAEFLLESKIADSIQFHVKCIPWFVSDVTFEDFDYTLKTLSQTENKVLASYGKLWLKRLQDRTFLIAPKENSQFWTLSRPYSEMHKHDPKLYQRLESSALIIFKGDMNFRKLVSDLAWDSEIPFATSVLGFSPAPLCTLRTLKADVVVGLAPGKAEDAAKKDEDWMVSGKYAIILAHLDA